MKTKPVFLSLALLLTTLGSIASEVSSKANDEPTTPIIIRPSHPGGTPRSQTIPVIEASYDEELCVVYLNLQNAGDEVNVVIENLTTLESDNYELPGDNSYILPFSGNSGVWHLVIELEDGSEYIGEFVL